MSQYLITAKFRPSRSRSDKSKPGVVYYAIYGPESSDTCARPRRCVNSDISGADAGVLEERRSEVLAGLRLIYCVIESLSESGVAFGLDDVVSGFRSALGGDSRMQDVVRRSRGDFAMQSGLVAVGREYRDCFMTSCGNPESFFEYVDVLSQSFRREHKVSRARGYLATVSNLRDYVGGRDVLFAEIDRSFVVGYADYLRGSGIAEMSQSFYLRTFRALLNHASEAGVAVNGNDWFRNLNMRIDHSGRRTLSRALDRDTLMKIEQLPLVGDKTLELVRDMFMFGFYCRGMELVDIANLTMSNIEDGYLVYRRRLKGLVNRVPLGGHARRIIDKYRSADSSYLFPLLDDSRRILFASVRNGVSQSIKAIGRMIDCPQLSFSMNIGTWKVLMSESNISDILIAGA